MSRNYEIKRPSKDVIEKLKKIETATAWAMIGKIFNDRRMRDAYYMENMRPLSFKDKLVGPALTVKFFPLKYRDILLDKLGMSYTEVRQKIWDTIQLGDVLVCAALGYKEGAKNVGIWGDVTSTSYNARGVKGLVVDGCVRDTPYHRKLFPVFLTGNGTVRGHRGVTPVAVNVEVECDGVRVRPGDIILGDEQGIIVIPIEIAEEVANMGLEWEEKESLARSLLREGKTIKEVSERGLFL